MIAWNLLSEGYWLHDRRHDQQHLIDVAIPAVAESRVLILHPGWWRGSLQEGDAIAFISAWLRELTLARLDFESEHYALVPVEAWEPERDLAEQVRRDADFERGAYIQGLRQLAASLPEFRILSYLAYVLSRPRPDFEALRMEPVTSRREVGAVVLHDASHRKIDVLVVDERGNAATAQSDGWLTPYAIQWQEGSTASVPEFVKWVAERIPYGDMTFGTPVVGSREGTVEDIALTLIRV